MIFQLANLKLSSRYRAEIILKIKKGIMKKKKSDKSYKEVMDFEWCLVNNNMKIKFMISKKNYPRNIILRSSNINFFFNLFSLILLIYARVRKYKKI